MNRARYLRCLNNTFFINKLISLLTVIFVFIIFSGCEQRMPNQFYKVAIINLVNHPILNDSIKGIKEGLIELGYFEDKNIEYLEFNANGELDKLNTIAIEVANTDAHVIIPVSTPVAQAIVNKIPPTKQIVFSTVTNPDDIGIQQKPPNVTGVSDSVNYEANLDLIIELFPKAKNIGIIYNAGERNSQFGVIKTRKLAKKRNLKLLEVTVSNSKDVFNATSALVGRVDIFYIGSDNTVVSGIASLLKTAYENRIPVIASDSGSVEKGALAAISVNYVKLGKKVAEQVDQVIKGKKAGELPVVYFVGDQLLINKKSAIKIGFLFPQNILDKANIVITE